MVLTEIFCPTAKLTVLRQVWNNEELSWNIIQMPVPTWLSWRLLIRRHVIVTNLLAASPDKRLDCGRGLSTYCLTFAWPSVFEPCQHGPAWLAYINTIWIEILIVHENPEDSKYSLQLNNYYMATLLIAMLLWDYMLRIEIIRKYRQKYVATSHRLLLWCTFKFSEGVLI